MALKETIVSWHEGVVAYGAGDYAEAVRKFEEIEDASARIYFNTACAYLRLNKVEAAFMSLNETVKKDPHLAIGHYCRGIQQVKLRRYEAAVDDFDHAIQRLRRNNHINYLQLGMDYKLHIEDIVISKAYALCSAGNSKDATEALISASQKAEADDAKRKIVDSLHRLQTKSSGRGRGRLVSLRDQDWYHAMLSRDEAENLLHYDGDFLVRQSKNRKTGDIQYVLSVYWQGYRHILFVQNSEEQWKFEGYAFPSIWELIEHHMNTHDRVTKRSRAELHTPIGRKVDNNNPLELVDLPDKCIFHPPKELIANLGKRNYIAQSKVISSTTPESSETLEVPDSNSTSSPRSSTSSLGSDGYLPPKPKPTRIPPKLPPSQNETTGQRARADRTENRSSENLKIDNSKHRNRSNSDDRGRNRGHSADKERSKRALPPLPVSSTSENQDTDAPSPPLPRSKRGEAKDDNIPDYVNVPKVVLPSRATGKGIASELTNVLNARLKASGITSSGMESGDSSNVVIPDHPPPRKRSTELPGAGLPKRPPPPRR